MNTTNYHPAILLSKKGFKELRKAILQLNQDHQHLLQKLKELDRSTNRDNRLERIELLDQLDMVGEELRAKQHTLAHAKPLPSHRARLKVALGSAVDLIDQHGTLFRYTLVDSIEANPSDGRISILSPLGQNLVGKQVNDSVQWPMGRGLKAATLIRVA